MSELDGICHDKHEPINIDSKVRDRLNEYLYNRAPRGMGFSDFITRALNEAEAEPQLSRMYTVASDYEKDVLDAVAERAGIIWVCPVAPWTNPVGEACDDCGRTREEAYAYVRQQQEVQRGS